MNESKNVLSLKLNKELNEGEAWILMRKVDNGMGICLTLKNSSDVEVFINKAEKQKLIDTLRNEE